MDRCLPKRRGDCRPAPIYNHPSSFGTTTLFRSEHRARLIQRRLLLRLCRPKPVDFRFEERDALVEVPNRERVERRADFVVDLSSRTILIISHGNPHISLAEVILPSVRPVLIARDVPRP